MNEEEIKDRMVAALVEICPERKNAISNPDNTMEEHLEFLEILAVYIPFDKEASCREAYELGITRGWEGKK